MENNNTFTINNSKDIKFFNINEIVSINIRDIDGNRLYPFFYKNISLKKAIMFNIISFSFKFKKGDFILYEDGELYIGESSEDLYSILSNHLKNYLTLNENGDIVYNPNIEITLSNLETIKKIFKSKEELKTYLDELINTSPILKTCLVEE